MLGTGELGFNGDGLDPLQTRLASPMAVRRGPGGELVVVDFSNMRIRALDAGGAVSTVAGSGFHAYSDVGAAALDSPLENPIDARWGPDGLLYIAPFHEGRVIRVDAAGRVELAVGSGENLEHGGDGGAAASATMGYPGGIAFGDDGSLYVSDWTNHRVRRVGPDGTIATVAGTGEAGFDPSGPGPEVRLHHPGALDVAADGALLIADGGNHRVARLDPVDLELSTAAGAGEAGFAGDGGPAVDALLDEPLGVLADPEGGFWIADSGNGVVRRVDADGDIVTRLGDPEAAPMEGSAGLIDARLRMPVGLAWGPGGQLWIGERDGHRVLEWRRE